MDDFNESSPLNLTTYCLEPHAKNHPNSVALLVVSSIGKHKQISYGDLYQRITEAASRIASLNLPRHSVVAIHTANPLDTVILFFSCIAANMVALPLLYSLTQEEIEFILLDSHAQLLITQNEMLKIRTNCKMLNTKDLMKLNREQFHSLKPVTKFSDPAYIFYTSGSTGKPKGVLHAQHVILARPVSIKNWLPIQPNDIVMQADNICWTYSMASGVFDPLLMGATALLYVPLNQAAKSSDNISGQQWLDLINYYNVTVLAATPDTYTSILSLPKLDKAQIPTLKYVGSAGAPLADKILEQWHQTFGFPIYTALGMSELSTFISTGVYCPPKKGKIGKIQPGRKVRLMPLTPTLEEVTVNTEGLLGIHQSEYGFMLGYIGISNKHQFREDWFVTSDLVSMDEEGYITYFGRNDIVLKVDGGYRVSPIEIENVLKTLSHVKEALCRADETPSESSALAVYIELDTNCDRSVIQAIYDRLKHELSDYKIPDIIHVAVEVKHNLRGKIIREQQFEVIESFYKKDFIGNG